MNTKRILSLIAVTLITFTTATAQRISVVTESGATSIYRTLQEAIEGADSGSTIYLPGGGFTLPDSVKITKRLTIIGIGHKPDNENADGSSTITGNVFFNEGSSGSALMSCYVTGCVNIGDGGATVNDVSIKFCNINEISVKNNTCQETVVNQSYIRSGTNFGGSNAQITNNVFSCGVSNVDGGAIAYNVITRNWDHRYGSYSYEHTTISIYANNTRIENNVLTNPGASTHWGSNCITNNNMFIGRDWGDYCINLETESWNDVFENYNNGNASPVSRFHFKGDYAQYEHEVGIYAGDGFNEDQLAPVPFIISKSIPQQTDAAGKLNIKIRVKAGD